MSSKDDKPDQLSDADLYQSVHESLSLQLRAGMGFLVPLNEPEENGLEIAAVVALLESLMPGDGDLSRSDGAGKIVAERDALAERLEVLEAELETERGRRKELEEQLQSHQSDIESAPDDAEITGRLAIRQYKSVEFEISLNKAECSIGRTSINDLQFKDPSVSRKHAILRLNNGAVEIVDCDSRNGVFVNDTRVSRSELCHGDMVMVGTQRFVFVCR